MLNARFEAAFADVFAPAAAPTVVVAKQLPARIGAPTVAIPSPAANDNGDRIHRTHRYVRNGRGGGVHTVRGMDEDEVYEAALDLKNSIDKYRSPAVGPKRVCPATGFVMFDVTYMSLD